MKKNTQKEKLSEMIELKELRYISVNIMIMPLVSIIDNIIGSVNVIFETIILSQRYLDKML